MRVKYLNISVFVGLLFLSCEKKEVESFERTILSDVTTITVDESISDLDKKGAVIPMYVSIEGVNTVKYQLLVENAEDKLEPTGDPKTLTIANKKGNVELDFDWLGVSKIDDEATVRFTPTLEGKELKHSDIIFSVVTPISFETEILDKKKNPVDKALFNVYQDSLKLKFKIAKGTNTIKSYKLERAKFSVSDGNFKAEDLTYVDIFANKSWSEDNEKKGDSIAKIDLTGVKELDTLYYKLTVTGENDIKVVSTKKIFVQTLHFKSSNMLTLGGDDFLASLGETKISKEESKSDIKLTDNFGNSTVTISTLSEGSDITFVEVKPGDYFNSATEYNEAQGMVRKTGTVKTTFDFADILAAKRVYDSGISVTSIVVNTNTVLPLLYTYKVTRSVKVKEENEEDSKEEYENKIFYGYLYITDILNSSGKDSLKFSFVESQEIDPMDYNK